MAAYGWEARTSSRRWMRVWLKWVCMVLVKRRRWRDVKICSFKYAIPNLYESKDMDPELKKIVDFYNYAVRKDVATIKQGEDSIECINKAMAFLSAIASRFPSSNNQLRASSNPRNQATIQDGKLYTTIHKSGKNGRMMLDSIDEGPLVYPTVVGEDGQTRPKKYSKLTEAQQLQDDCDVQETNIILYSLPPHVYLLVNHQEAHGETMHLAKEAKKLCMVQGDVNTEDLDAYDSDSDDISSAKAVPMVNLSSCDLDVLSEVSYSDPYPNDMINQDVQEMTYFEQTHIVNFPDNEITSDSNINPYSQYLQESQDAEHQSDTKVFTMTMEILLEPTSNKLCGRRFSTMDWKIKNPPASLVWAYKAVVDIILDFINLFLFSSSSRSLANWLADFCENGIGSFGDVFEKIFNEHSPTVGPFCIHDASNFAAPQGPCIIIFDTTLHPLGTCIGSGSGGVTTALNSKLSPENGMLTWMLDSNGERLTAVNADGELTTDTKNMLTWQVNNNDDGYSPVNGMLTWMLDSNGERLTAVNADGELTTDTKNMLTWQVNNNDDGYSPVNGEMLTWQKNEEDEVKLAKVLEEASSEMMTCQKRQVKIINDYPYWLPLKFQTSSAYVTINGNEELCGSSFSDSNTSYMAGISGAWIGLADEARGEMELEWGECEDEMLASFLGESECWPRAGFFRV
nr:hypothetical protein [Tanacetum cinerariifolium]